MGTCFYYTRKCFWRWIVVGVVLEMVAWEQEAESRLDRMDNIHYTNLLKGYYYI